MAPWPWMLRIFWLFHCYKMSEHAGACSTYVRDEHVLRPFLQMPEQVKRCSIHITMQYSHDVNILFFFSTLHRQLTTKIIVHAGACGAYVQDELVLRTCQRIQEQVKRYSSNSNVNISHFCVPCSERLKVHAPGSSKRYWCWWLPNAPKNEINEVVLTEALPTSVKYNIVPDSW